jgi:hypothetical protein
VELQKPHCFYTVDKAAPANHRYIGSALLPIRILVKKMSDNPTTKKIIKLSHSDNSLVTVTKKANYNTKDSDIT